jgi:ubiquinone/menaquinone biosynthesis C-methylase UbiE
MKVNFGNVAKNYALYRNDLPEELLESLKLRGFDLQAKKVADIGSGTGVLTRALYLEGAKVIGVEPDKELIQEAEHIDEAEGIRIQYKNNYAELTGLEGDSFDYGTVLRAWHWFNRIDTLEEIKRILKEEGTLIIMDSGFISQGKVIQETFKIIEKYMPDRKIKAAGSKAESKQLINSFPVEWFKEWKNTGFHLRDTYNFDYTVSFSNEAWCGRVASLSWLTQFSEEERGKIINELFNHLNEEFGETTHSIKHRCYVAILNNEATVNG